ncbi:MAG: hypothetical protein RRA15_11955 [bacterium]|nr:hypothetical protein [bacterium]MDT8367180.1 hypothetical protein [bacterium]
MQKVHSHSRKMRGQTLVLAVVLLSLCSTLMLGMFQVSLAVQEKIRLQLSADMAVLSALNCQANGLNTIAMANRAILANDAMAGQINAMVSEATFYRRLTEEFKKLLRFIPYAGPVSSFISSGAHAIEKVIRKTASVTLPLTHYSNAALRKAQETVRILLPFYSLRAARTTLKENMPQAQMTIPSEALVLRQARSLQKRFTEVQQASANTLKAKTMDRHTLKRNWRIKVAGLSPAKKTGGTTITSDDLVSRDKLQVKVFKRLRWRWKTALTTQSRASDFGYQTPATLMSIDTSDIQSALSLPILVQSDMPSSIVNGPFKEKKLLALSAGRLLYRRDNREDETENIFNPFWRAELMPVASEPTAKRLIPEMILKEVRH